MHVEEINDIERLGDLRLAWNALLAQTPGASFFQSLDWLTVYWRHFGHGQRLRALLVSCGGRPIGILPLTVADERTRLGRMRVLTYPLDEWGTFYGPIGPNPAATLTSGLAHIRRTPRDWDLLELRCVRTAGLDRGRTENALCMAGLSPQCTPWANVALIDLSGGWNGYWSSRNRRWRSNVRRCERKLAESGEVLHVRYRPEGVARGGGGPRWDYYDACEQLAAASWQGSRSDGNTLSHESVRAFLRDAHEAAAQAGALDLNLLCVAGKPAAFTYCYAFRGEVFGLRMGYDPLVSKDGAGTVLIARMLEDSCSRGDTLFNFGSDYLECKRNWLTSVEQTHRCSWFPPTARAQALRLKRKWTGRRAEEVEG